MNSNLVKKILPHIVAIFAFYVLTLIYFLPEFVDHKSLQQSDMIHYKGMVQENSKFLQENGEPSMWNGRMFSGMPAYLTYPIFPYGAIPTFEAILRGGIPEQMGAHLLFLTMICTYIMLLCFRTKAFWSAVGGIVFALTTYNLILIEVGHITKLWAIAYAALILGGIKLAYRNKIFLGFALAALGMALEVKASHYQITYYFGFICLIFGINELVFAIKEKQIPAFVRQSIILLIAFALGIGVNAGKLMTTAEYSPYSTRGGTELSIATGQQGNQSNEGLSKDYAFSWSQGIGETFTLLIPKLYGGASSEKLSESSETYKILKQSGQYSEAELQNLPIPFYHGSQPFTAGPIYAGAIVCLLFVWGLVSLSSREKWWALAAVLLTMAFAWGENFASLNYFLFDHVPGFNKFRSVSMALSLTILVMVLVGFETISQKIDLLMEKSFDDKQRKKFETNLWITAGIVGGLCVLILLLSGSFGVTTPSDSRLGQLADYVRQDRLGMIRSSAIRSLVLIALVIGLIYFYSKKTISQLIAFMAIGVLAIGDVFLVGKDYLGSSNFEESPQEKAVQQQPIDEEIFKDKELGFRVMSLQNFQQESRTSYFHRSVGGYFAAKMQRYQDLIERQLNKEQDILIGSLQQGQRPNFTQIPVLNMLNTKYITFGSKKEQLLMNPSANGTAWFVDTIKKVNSPDEEMASLSNTNLNQTAIIDVIKFTVDKTTFDKDSTASIQMTNYNSNVVEYEATNTNDGFAVFSEIYYPHGWTATIDGQETPIVAVNYVLRGLAIPKGKHKIIFTFKPQVYQQGALITQVSSWLVVLSVLVSLGFAVWKGVKE